MTRAILFDMGGVLHNGQAAIPGAAAAIGRARAAGLAVRFVTNTSRRTAAAVLAQAAAMGLHILPGEIHTAPLAARDYLQQHGLRPFCLVHPDLAPEFAGLDQSSPNAVLVTDAGEHFSYAALNQAFRLCLAGAPLVASGDNRYFHDGRQLSLDAGPFVKALEYASGTRAVITGKPAPAFFASVLAGIGCAPAEALMIGDDAHSDIDGALRAGLQACLVRTGKYRAGDEAGLACRVADSVVEAVDAALA